MMFMIYYICHRTREEWLWPYEMDTIDAYTTNYPTIYHLPVTCAFHLPFLNLPPLPLSASADFPRTKSPNFLSCNKYNNHQYLICTKYILNNIV